MPVLVGTTCNYGEADARQLDPILALFANPGTLLRDHTCTATAAQYFYSRSLLRPPSLASADQGRLTPALPYNCLELAVAWQSVFWRFFSRLSLGRLFCLKGVMVEPSPCPSSDCSRGTPASHTGISLRKPDKLSKSQEKN